jgi:mono/diheme cytochrome c family protein
VLARVDRIVAALSWVAAGVLVLMLLIGPQVIAEDKSKPSGEAAGSAPYASGEDGRDGKAVFTESCGSCHALQAAGTNGQVGPALDGTSLGTADIEAIVRDGSSGMPAFEGDLSDAEISAVAAFVAASR